MHGNREDCTLYIICGPWSIVMLETNLVVPDYAIITEQCKISLI